MQNISNNSKIKLTSNARCLLIIFLLLLNYFFSLVTFSSSSVSAEDQVLYENENFVLTSLGFRPGGRIGTTYTADGANISPPLSWVNPPASTVSYAVIMEDPDGVTGHLIHWIIYDIPANKRALREGIKPKAKLPDGSIQALNSSQKIGYDGPSPPPGATHSYFLTLYALDTFSYSSPSFSPPETDMQAFEHFLNLHSKGKSELMCTYGRR
jgi:Raf kinase inhibitor-like YbhB/YbcL family protein